MKRFSDAQVAEMERVGADVTVVGKRLFGRDWIGNLTEGEQALLAKHGPRPGKYGGTTIAPCPAQLISALDRALGKDQRILHQRGAACDWLLDHGLSSVGCDPIALATALAKQSPADEDSIMPKVGRPDKYRAVAHRITLDLATGRRTMQQFEATENKKNLPHWYEVDPATFKKAMKLCFLALSNFS